MLIQLAVYALKKIISISEIFVIIYSLYNQIIKNIYDFELYAGYKLSKRI